MSDAEILEEIAFLGEVLRAAGFVDDANKVQEFCMEQAQSALPLEPG